MNPAEALRRVPRENFIPDLIWVRRDDGWAVPLRRADDPERWLEMVRDGDSITTQVDDGATEKGTWPTSSASALHIVTTMLETLKVEPGVKVLEIGAGTGYNAALLAELAGPSNVTTIEIDPDVAEQARAALARSGYGVKVVTGDGTHGHADGAPYDRVIATAAVYELPYTWVEQTRPGGFILAPWGPTVHPDEPLALLRVSEGGTAEGRFTCPGWFMPMRGQRVAQQVRHETRETWEKQGKPALSRFGITVTNHGTRIWLDSPDNPIG
ncbi:methyltransferase domain-containing protein [Actinomadura roseirufa]|uniref:methyltransferase domain-containing protein n=1 Tax=Actinomadura roseirufa TaxID=2094049 RepID=UPI0010416A66|nr:methyltransferase domain-containing protein [Actinomadura roseirufa]